MDFRRLSFPAALAALALTASALPTAAHAITAKQCYDNFRAASKAGTLKNQSYKDYKASQCGDSAAPATTTGTATPATTMPAPGSAMSGSSMSGTVVYPRSVSSKYASLSAGKARMQTCLDQYNANKASNGNGNLKWIQKGGGYYSQCNTRLKQK